MPVFVQSYWSSNNLSGGWLSPKFHLMGWALGAFRINQLSPKSSLLTDTKGYELLIDKLKLPYQNVELLFDKYHNSYPELWVLKKLFAYSNQTEPFVHIDGDAFLFKSLHSELLSADIIAQNYEYNHPYYIAGLDEILQKCSVPNFLLNTSDSNKYSAFNAGIIGGTNTQVFKELYDTIIGFLEINRAVVPHLDSYNLNIILEQLFLKKLVDEKQITISYLLKEKIGYPHNYRLDRFVDLPNYCDYIHLMNYKRNPTACEQMAQRLWIDSPELYERCEVVARQLKATKHPISLPTELIESYRSTSLPPNAPKEVLADILDFEQQKREYMASLPSEVILLEQWRIYSLMVNEKLSMPTPQLLQQSVRHSPLSKRIVSEWDWAEANEFLGQDKEFDYTANIVKEAGYFEVILYVYLHLSAVREHLLDVLNILILDAFEEPQPFGQGIEIIWQQLSVHQPSIDETQTKNAISTRIRFFLYHGVLTF